MIAWIFASLASNVAIIATEYLNRQGAGGPWLAVLPMTFVPIVLAQYCLFHAFGAAPHWFTAWAVFSIGNSAVRVAAVALLAGHEVASWPVVVAGIAGMVACGFVLKSGLS